MNATHIIASLCFLLVTAVHAQEVVLAKNDWTIVTKADFDAEIARIPKEQQYEFLASAERVARTVEALLVNKTLAAKARAAKLESDPVVQGEIRSQVERILARHQGERDEARLKVPDFDKRAEELYKASLRKYAEKDTVHAMHILVDTKCRTPEAAKARIEEARAELDAGKPFADVAKKYSDDPSAKRNGGDLGPLLFDSLSPEFAEAATALKPGEVSKLPVSTPFGFHIIRLESKKSGRQYRFEEVKASIVAELKEEWLKQQRKAYVDAIRTDPKLKLDLDAIQALKTNLNAPPAQPKRPG